MLKTGIMSIKTQTNLKSGKENLTSPAEEHSSSRGGLTGGVKDQP